MTEATQKVIVEIGKCYEINPKWKKSFIETEFFTTSDGTKTVSIETTWRSGTVRITPLNETEVEWLQTALDSSEENEYGIEFEPMDFEDYEFIETWDGCGQEEDFIGSGWTDEEMNQIIEELEDEFASTVLEERGFGSSDMEVIIYNGIVATEVE